jgi:Sulfotransferase family
MIADFPMKTPRPNLFLIGSMKSGTSYLSELLGAHPAIFMSAEKEPTYFVDPTVLRRDWPRMWAQGYWRSEERYLNLFAAAGDAAVIGEGSTCYAKLPMYTHVVDRILAFNPQARFIYIMRDPIERTISHYWHFVGSSKERRPMLAAIQANPEYTNVSYYARQLAEYLRHVERERIFVLTFEELLASPAEQMSRIYAWLGVDSSFRLPDIGARHVTPAVVEQARGGLAFLNRFRGTSTYGKLGRYIPRAARRLGSQVVARRVRRAEVSTQQVCAYLRPLQLRQTDELASLLGRTFREWKTIFAEPGQDEPVERSIDRS